MSPMAGRNQARAGRVATVVMALLLGSLAEAQQDAPDAVEEALDQTVDNVAISKLPIRDALTALQKRTRLRFEITDSTVELLPYGARTKVNIVLANITLRRGLLQVLDGLGLTMTVNDGGVLLEPAPVLRRLGRRMTIAEVELLARLAAKPWTEARQGEGVPLQFEIPPQSQPAQSLEQAIAQVPGATALRQLEAATAALGWVWMPREGAVVCMTRRDFMTTLLDRPMAFNYQRTPLDALFEDIGRRAGVRIAFDPGVLANVAARDRAVDLVTPRGTARQMLDRLCGNIGLAYELGDEGVRVFLAAPVGVGAPQLGSAPDGGASIAQAGLPRVVAILRTPIGADGKALDFLLREDELPADILKHRQEVLEEAFAELREIIARRQQAARP